MKILIFGAGALGSVFGGFLSKKNDVTLIGRKPHIELINKRGLIVSGIWGEHLFAKPRGYDSIKEVPKGSEFDLIMITVKSYDTQDSIHQFMPLVSDSTVVMSMQNGIGNEEVISKNLGADKTLGGMAIFGSRFVEPGHVQVTVYASECLVGGIEGRSKKRSLEIARVFSDAGIPTKASDNIIRDKWMKAMYNIALNPLSAILRVPYGELGKNPASLDMMSDMLREAFLVAEKQGVPLKLTWEGYFKHLLEKQLPPTAEHKSSMLQDIERGRMTEIDYLNGAIVELGKKTGIETPVNNTVTRIIKALEKRNP